MFDNLRRHLEVVAWILMVGIFAIDLNYPAGFAANLLYVGVILLALWSADPRLAYHVAALGTFLSVVDYFLSPPGGDLTAAYFNRGVGALVLWVTAAGVRSYRRTVAQREKELTARLRAEDALRKSVKDLIDLKYAIDEASIVSMTSVQGNITYVNNKFCEIARYTRDELHGRNHRLLNSGLHPPEFFKEMYQAIGHGQAWRGEIRNRAKDGTLYWVDTTIVPFIDDRGYPYQYVGIQYDITERKRSEAALREQESFAQLGKMAAVVAHEVRNPLAGIRGALQVIGRRLGDDSRERSIATEIINRIDTLNTIVNDLLQFARPRRPVVTTVPIASIVHDTVGLLREDPTLSNLEVQVEDRNVSVSADAEQLKLVLLNLLINSAQAMNGTGTIQLSTEKHNGWIELRVVDHGPGIPPHVRDHLFEPFFTTKHRGTGLGLATARRILDAHHGTIDLHSPATGGTVAIVRLPEHAPKGEP